MAVACSSLLISRRTVSRAAPFGSLRGFVIPARARKTLRRHVKAAHDLVAGGRRQERSDTASDSAQLRQATGSTAVMTMTRFLTDPGAAPCLLVPFASTAPWASYMA